MIWLALAYTAAILEVSSIYTRCTAIIFIRLLPSTTNFPEAKLSSTFLSPIFWKYSKTFQQQPENIQRLFRLQNCLSRKSSTVFRKYSKTFSPANLSEPQIINCIPETFKDFLGDQQQQPTATTSISNLQQQPAATINSSNKQHQPAATINSNNQQQQLASAIYSSNQQQQSTAAISSINQQQQSTAAISSIN